MNSTDIKPDIMTRQWESLHQLNWDQDKALRASLNLAKQHSETFLYLKSLRDVSGVPLMWASLFGVNDEYGKPGDFFFFVLHAFFHLILS